MLLRYAEGWWDPEIVFEEEAMGKGGYDIRYTLVAGGGRSRHAVLWAIKHGNLAVVQVGELSFHSIAL